jgi:nucleoside-diphosphate-sugar epimerase
LFLGEAGSVVTGSTAPDPHPETRNDYARAKALADAALLQFHQQSGLPLVLIRPGLVVGSGTSPFHGGLGFFNNDQYCVGWNGGRNPLPWVLADDCADAIVAALTAPAAVGKAYNLVGDVCPSAQSYISDLAKVLGRPLHFVPSSPTGLWLTEMGKWAIKRVAGQSLKRPYRRDLLSRGILARFDCTDAKQDLGWKPVADPAEFHRRALAVHAEG